jgi:phage replication initiation protein
MKNATKIDFFSYRVKDQPDLIYKALQATFSSHPYELKMRARNKGWNGYEHSYDVFLSDMKVGMVASGGEHQKNWAYVGIDGSGCSWIDDWDRAQQAPIDLCDDFGLKRVDIALDTYGDKDSFNKVTEAYDKGLFCPPGKGRPPKGESILSKRPEDGNTFYVGSRENDKFYRGYEKGKQMLGPMITAAMTKNPDEFDWSDWVNRCEPVTDLEGSTQLKNVWDWFRHEVEFKPKTQPLPDDLIDRRDQYFTGSYPYLSTVLEGVEPELLILSRQRKIKTDLSVALFNIRRMYGKTLFTALAAYHGDVGAVWDRIVSDSHNERLLQDGVLLVDHE